jgi:hypothetical protein
MRITVQVTQRDIRLGKHGDPWNCPIARAIKRVVRRGAMEGVIGSYFYLGTETRKLPAKAERFVSDFESKAEVYPFSFVLNVPAKYLLSSSVAARTR